MVAHVLILRRMRCPSFSVQRRRCGLRKARCCGVQRPVQSCPRRYHGGGITGGGSPVPVSVRGLAGVGSPVGLGPWQGRRVPWLDGNCKEMQGRRDAYARAGRSPSSKGAWPGERIWGMVSWGKSRGRGLVGSVAGEEVRQEISPQVLCPAGPGGVQEGAESVRPVCASGDCT